MKRRAGRVLEVARAIGYVVGLAIVLRRMEARDG